MNNFSYFRAPSVAEASSADLGDAHRIIAGGTNLVDLMKYRVENPDTLIDITRLALSGIEDGPDGGLRLGALVTNAATAYDERVKARYPVLSEAILSGASTQLRNMATNGGNLLQRTRCYYFYDTASPCNKREPGSGCPAFDGLNRIHAILGTSAACIATHPSDLCVALAALGARVNVTGRSGERVIDFADFHRLPGDRPERDTNLEPGDVVTSIDLPENGFAEHSTYLKVRDRESYAFALVSVAACLEFDGETYPPYASHWAAWPTSPGAYPKPRPCCGVSPPPKKTSWPWPNGSSKGRAAMAITISRSPWPGAPSYVP